MSRFKGLVNRLQNLLPSPFTIAIILTLVAMTMAMLNLSQSEAFSEFSPNLIASWSNGLWQSNQLVFAFQMMLMLVLGHVLALSKPMNSFIRFVAASFCTTTAKAAGLVTLLTMIMALCNWGLGLVFGAVFARKVAEFSEKEGNPINFPLVAAAGYSGMMVWHGGLSGSALVKVAEEGHLSTMIGHDMAAIPLSQTVFSGMNIFATLAVLVLAPLMMFYLGKRNPGSQIKLPKTTVANLSQHPIGAEKIDHFRMLGYAIGILVLSVQLVQAFNHDNTLGLAFITPNWINASLLGLALTFHGQIASFITAVKSAISGAAGILIQFPLYFGIAAIMNSGGLIELFSGMLTQASASQFSILTFFSAGIVNVFVPSGGGQWVVQGPIIIEGCKQLGIPFSKGILALAYGDQLTNMLQPFWALPLLGITGLKVRDILPYTLALMILGTLIFLSAIILF